MKVWRRNITAAILHFVARLAGLEIDRLCLREAFEGGASLLTEYEQGRLVRLRFEDNPAANTLILRDMAELMSARRDQVNPAASLESAQ